MQYSEELVAPVPSGCAHHWIIRRAEGTRYSSGVCEKCGLIKDFDNALDHQGWAGPRTGVRQ